MMSDASDMLAAALEQMDGIIAGNHTLKAWTLRPGSVCFFKVGMAQRGLQPHLETIGVRAGSATSCER